MYGPLDRLQGRKPLICHEGFRDGVGKTEKKLALSPGIGSNGTAMRQGIVREKMQPVGKLPAHVVKDFADWIERGAPWPTTGKVDFAVKPHWAFQPVKNVPPTDDPTGWAKHPIDRYIAAKLREQGLKPVQAADARTLLRRVTFDLIGLPVGQAFQPDAKLSDVRLESLTYEKAVDHLLASPRYGERWGRHWMDVVRYADTAGDNSDFPVPQLYRYRNYVIDSFNQDKPYDQFIKEQLAGDLIPHRSEEERRTNLIATGY